MKAWWASSIPVFSERATRRSFGPRNTLELLKRSGFVKGKASACNFRHVLRDVKVTVHGDDFLVTGSRSDLLRLQNKLGSKYEIKTHLLGPEDE